MGLVHYIFCIFSNLSSVVDIVRAGIFTNSSQLYAAMTTMDTRVLTLRKTMLDNDMMIMGVVVEQNNRDIENAIYAALGVLYKVTNDSPDDPHVLELLTEPDPEKHELSNTIMSDTILARCHDYLSNAANLMLLLRRNEVELLNTDALSAAYVAAQQTITTLEQKIDTVVKTRKFFARDGLTPFPYVHILKFPGDRIL
jgi:hypothetical protein